MYQKIAVLFLIFFPFIVFSEDLLIVEVQVRGASPSESYIKIYNQGKEIKDISGYRIVKKSSAGREYSVRVFPKESFIFPQEYFLWANSKNNYHLSVGADVYSATEISSNNSIALLTKDKNLIDSLAWGDGENQFFTKNPFFSNPQEKELIKRIEKDGIYQNTQDNSKDFYLFSEKEPLKLGQKEDVSTLQKEVSFPFKEGISTAVVLSFLTLILKRNLEKNGRP